MTAVIVIVGMAFLWVLLEASVAERPKRIADLEREREAKA